MNWHSLDIEEIVRRLDTHLDKGLSEEEAQRRLKQYGPNELLEGKSRSVWQMFADQFKDFMIIVLFVAAIVSALLSEWTDAIVIIIVVVLNAVLGVVQEYRAEQALAALKKMAAPNAKVMRDGQVKVIPASDLVPGDIVILDAGDYVPADLRLIEAANLKAEESSLTGESVPVDKDASILCKEDAPLGDRINVAYMTTAVTYGRGKGIVVGTGMNTEVGRIAELINEQDEMQTPLQKRLEQLGKILAIAALGICIVIFLAGILYGRNWLDMFMTAVSLAVAAIPEGLPAIVTIVLAIGVQRMAKRNAIIRRLPAVETLGAATVICSDKTGTLTQNRMTVQRIYAGGRMYDANEQINVENNALLKLLLNTAILCNDATEAKDGSKEIGDPTETALVNLGAKLGFHKAELEQRMPRIDEVPFDSDRKLMTTVHKNGDKYIAFTKGAPDELLKRCKYINDGNTIREINQNDIDNILKINDELASQALRVLAMAYKEPDNIDYKDKQSELESELIFIGMVGMIDPPRPEAKEAVDLCRSAGIKPVMITGDHRLTAIAIGKELGILQSPDEAVTGQEIDELSDDEMVEKVPHYSVYARVSPEHKVRIVKAWQRRGDVVAMTGDGVNDAPALKSADIGAAMGKGGTDVAKGAADMILTDDNFATIVAAVEEGRIIYANIIKAIQFLLSCNIGEILVLFISTILNWIQPLLPMHILWINLVTDSLPAIGLGMENGEKDIMKRPPRDPKESILPMPMFVNILWQGLVICAATLIAFRIGSSVSIELGRTMAFLVLGLSQLAHSINMRSQDKSIFAMKWSDNRFLSIAILTSAATQLMVVFIPFLRRIFKLDFPDPVHWLYAIALSLVPIAVVEIWKLVKRLKNKI